MIKDYRLFDIEQLRRQRKNNSKSFKDNYNNIGLPDVFYTTTKVSRDAKYMNEIIAYVLFKVFKQRLDERKTEFITFKRTELTPSFIIEECRKINPRFGAGFRKNSLLDFIEERVLYFIQIEDWVSKAGIYFFSGDRVFVASYKYKGLTLIGISYHYDIKHKIETEPNFDYSYNPWIHRKYWDYGKMPYNEQLSKIEWRLFRSEVLTAYGNRCMHCDSSDDLQVHHNYYKNDGRYAWQYSFNDVTVLCRKCHEQVHGIINDDDFEYALQKD